MNEMATSFTQVLKRIRSNLSWWLVYEQRQQYAVWKALHKI